MFKFLARRRFQDPSHSQECFWYIAASRMDYAWASDVNRGYGIENDLDSF